MTTTYENQTNTDTMAALAASDPTESVATYEIDPDTFTIAEAWSSSPLEVPDENRYDVAQEETTDERKRDTERAKLFAVLAAGIIGGATVGAVLFGSIEPAKPTFIVPNSGVSTSPMPSRRPRRAARVCGAETGRRRPGAEAGRSGACTETRCAHTGSGSPGAQCRRSTRAHRPS